MQNAVESSAPGAVPESSSKPATPPTSPRPEEIGGPTGPEPTRYGDWERNGRCIDF
jgi:hypothetical protein